MEACLIKWPFYTCVLNLMGGRPDLPSIDARIDVESGGAATVAAKGGLPTWGFKSFLRLHTSFS